MSAFDCFQEYLALKNHFTKPSYDYHKYGGKTGVKVATFEKRRDRVFFQKLAKHPDYKQFLLANLVKDEKAWIKDLAYSEEAEQTYLAWLKRQQSLTYSFKTELGMLEPNFDQNFLCVDHEHPILLKQYLAGTISLETLCILLKLTGAKKHWDQKMEYDVIWDAIKVTVEKYTPFLKYDQEKMKQIVVDYFAE